MSAPLPGLACGTHWPSLGLLVAWCVLALLHPAKATLGLPFIDHHSPGEGGFGETCMSTAHGPDGTVYAGSNEGILEFDGSRWRNLPTPGRTQVRSVALLKDGSIAWGAINEFGLYAPDARRDWKARALSDSLNAADLHFMEIRSIHELEHGLYFQSAEFLARWHKGHLQLWQPGGIVGGAKVVDGALYVQAEGKGLFRLRPERLSDKGNALPATALEPVLGPGLFDNGNRMVCLFPSTQGLLLGTRKEGLFLLQGRQAQPLSGLQARLKEWQLFDGIRLRDGRLALATLQGGMLVLDSSGQLLQQVSQPEGLSSSQVLHLSQDATGDVWAANMDGLNQIGLSRPYTQFNSARGLRGRIESMVRHEGHLVVGTTEGIFQLQEDPALKDEGRFQALGPEGICWSLLSTDEALLAIVGSSLVELSESGQREILAQPRAVQLDARNPRRALVAVGSGLRLLLRRGRQWELGPWIPGVKCTTDKIICDPHGHWWLGTSDKGLLRLEESGGEWILRSYGQEQGLPRGNLELSLVHQHLVVLVDGRCWEFDEVDSLQVCDWIHPPDGWHDAGLSQLLEAEGWLWGIFHDGVAKTSLADPDHLDWLPLFRSTDGFHLGPLVADAHNLWIGKGKVLLRLDTTPPPTQGQTLTVRLRHLLLGGREWAGSAGGLRPGEVIHGSAPLEIEAVCAASTREGLQQWSWFIGGLDKEWGPWSEQGNLRLPWLPGGDYVIRLRHRVGNGPAQELEVARLSVPLPWHGHWWVRLLLLIALWSIIHLLVKRRAQRLQQHNTELAAEVQERRQAESALQLSEAYYRSLFEHSMDGILILNLQGEICHANPAAQHILQVSEEVLRGRRPADFSPSLQADGRESLPVQQRSLEMVKAGENLASDWSHQLPDGRVLRLDVNLSLLEGGEQGRILAVVRDQSERHELEEKLRQSQKLEAVGRLAGGIAHDFNNILMVIQGQSDLILMGSKGHSADSSLREDLMQIRDATRRATDLTRQLLAFSRKQNLHPQHVSLNCALADVERMLRRVLGEHIEIKLELGADLQAVSVDPGQLDQVVVNLAVNARDAMPEGGRLIVETANVHLEESLARELDVKAGAFVRLSMRDTGHGMDEGTRAHIFEPFFTTKEPGKGTGLGLATVYGIVIQSGGAIQVESAPGMGCTFHIYLPASATTESLAAIGEGPGLDELGGSERILLVEDEAAVRDVLQRILENNGYLVHLAKDGQQALDLLLGGLKADLVLSDVVMPNLGGMELAHALRTVGHSSPLVLMTGYTDAPLDEAQCRELKLGVLMKPFGPRTLLAELRKWLAPSEMRDEAWQAWCHLPG